MNYNSDWEIKEQFIDDKLAKLKKEQIIEDETLKGISIKDALIINNWLFYAKKIGDETYKIICDEPYFSNYIDTKLTKKAIKELSLN